MEPRNALRDGFANWLEHIVQGSRVRTGRRLEPFGTSLRNSARLVPWLGQTERGEALTVTDRVQAVADMRAMHLVLGEYPRHRLTALGSATLARWRELGVDNESRDDEIARCAALFGQAARLGVGEYLDMYGFWCELTAIRPAEHWLADVFSLYLPSYLDQSDPSGYNPFRVLIAATGGELGSEQDWRDWAESERDANLAAFVNRIEKARPGGRRAFCQGMEAYRIARTEPRALPGKLAEWGIPHA